MKFKLKRYLADAVFLLIVVATVVVSVWQIPAGTLQGWVGGHTVLGVVIFILLMMASTVVPPITIFPIIPFVGVLFGPFLTTIYSVVGWTIGSVIAFLLARYCGKPFLSKFMSLEKIEKYEAKVPKKNEFWVFLFLRTILPVDVLSYAVGLFSKISFPKYFLASFLGVIPFSFIFAYGYDIFFLQNIWAFVIAVVIIVFVLLGLYFFNRK